jgi:hypothetical protein
VIATRSGELLRLSVERCCRVLKVPRAVYYRYLKRCPKQVDEALLVRVRELQAEFVGYGYRRVAAQLAKEGWNYSEKQIRRILKAEGLMRRRPRIGKRTTYAKRMKDAQNLVRGANSFAPHELWCCDVTAIRLYGRWAYVAVVLDVCLRKVVGWAVDVRNDARLTRGPGLDLLRAELRRARGTLRRPHELLRSRLADPECLRRILLQHLQEGRSGPRGLRRPRGSGRLYPGLPGPLQQPPPSFLAWNEEPRRI